MGSNTGLLSQMLNTDVAGDSHIYTIGTFALHVFC